MKILLITILFSLSSFSAYYDCGHNLTIEVHEKKIVVTLSDGYVSVYTKNKDGDYCKQSYDPNKEKFSCIQQDGKHFNFFTSKKSWVMECKLSVGS